MKLLPTFLLSTITLLLASCGGTAPTTTGPEPTVPVTLDHRLEGNVLITTATVTNNTAEPLTLIKNRNFFGLSVKTADPADSRVIFPKIVTFPPVVSSQVANLAPGQSTTFEASFLIRPLNELAFELERREQPFNPRSYQVMQSRKLVATFDYSHHDRFLNERSKKIAQNFLTTPIKTRASFQLPPLGQPGF